MNGAKKKQAIILSVLGLVLVGVLASQLMGRGGAPKAQATQMAAGGQGPVGAAALPTAEPRVTSVFQRANVNLDSLVQEIKAVEFEYGKDKIDRDPTLPLVGEAMLLRAKLAKVNGTTNPEDALMVAKRMKVTGIIWDAASPMAVIDDAVVGVGYKFEDAVFVKAIERDHVVLGVTGQDVEVVSELKEH